MTWSASLTGHCDTEEQERAVVAALQVMVDSAGTVGTAGGQAFTQFHGTLVLTAAPSPAVVPEEPTA